MEGSDFAAAAEARTEEAAAKGRLKRSPQVIDERGDQKCSTGNCQDALPPRSELGVPQPHGRHEAVCRKGADLLVLQCLARPYLFEVGFFHAPNMGCRRPGFTVALRGPDSAMSY